MYLTRSGKVLALFSLLFVAGCSSTGGASNDVGSFFPSAGDNTFKIDSNPSGVAVYVMGEQVGVTPLKLGKKDVFPNIYPMEKVSLYGKVTLKQEGCAEFTRPINAEIINSGLLAQLDCADKNPPLTMPSGSTPRISESIEQRLDKIKELLNKGLISEEEAKKARAHVLNEL